MSWTPMAKAMGPDWAGVHWAFLGVVQVAGEEHVAEGELTVGADGEADGEAGGPVSAGDIATAFEVEAERAGAVDEAGGGDDAEGGEPIGDGGGIGEGTGAAGLAWAFPSPPTSPAAMAGSCGSGGARRWAG